MFRFLIIAVTVFLLTEGTVIANELMQFRTASDTAENVFYKLSGGQQEVFASGKIDSGATERFIRFVQDNSITDAIVLFDSPGGSLAEAISLGKAIRSLQFNTGIGSCSRDGKRLYQGICASSCVYAFAGGIYRFYYGNKEKLGIHQFYSLNSNQADIGDIQIVSSILIDYLQYMGVDPQAFVLASKAEKGSMFWLTPSQSIFLGLSNNGSEPTSVEIKMTKFGPYLKVEQVHWNVIARFIMGCYNKKITIMAGIVTTPELSLFHQSNLKRSYLEAGTIPGEILVESGSSCTEVAGSVLWLQRTPSYGDLQKIIQADDLGVWTENGGLMRWGTTIDLRPVREKMHYFTKTCLDLGE